MTKSDPYHDWLGISKEHLPANHYRLLGIALFEANPQVINDAAKNQSDQVRRRVGGSYDPVAHRLLSQLDAARACLCDVESKLQYDRQLLAVMERRGAGGTATPVPDRRSLREQWAADDIEAAADSANAGSANAGSAKVEAGADGEPGEVQAEETTGTRHEPVPPTGPPAFGNDDMKSGTPPVASEAASVPPSDVQSGNVQDTAEQDVDEPNAAAPNGDDQGADDSSVWQASRRCLLVRRFSLAFLSRWG